MSDSTSGNTSSSNPRPGGSGASASSRHGSDGSGSRRRHRTHYRQERRRKLLRRAVIIGFFLLCLVGIVGYESRDLLSLWRAGRVVHQAKDCFDRADYSCALPLLRQALQWQPKHLAASWYLAEIYDQSKHREALEWRQRVTELEPGKAKHLLALAGTAVRLQEWVIADQALAAIAEKERNTVQYHLLAADVVRALKRPVPELEQHFVQALALEPANEAFQLSVAQVQLLSTNVATQQAARSVLEKLKEKPAFHLPALRALVEGKRQSKDDPDSLALAKELAASQQATFNDRLLWLEILQQRQMPDFADSLQQLQQTTATNAQNIGELIHWMSEHELAIRAVQWTTNFSRQDLDEPPVHIALAEAYTRLNDWENLGIWVNRPTWKENDYLRLAYAARVAREQSEDMDADSFSRQARQAAQRDSQRLNRLAELFSAWGWDREAVETWWSIARDTDRPKPALVSLCNFYKAKKDTLQLYRAAKALYQLSSADSLAVNEYAWVSLLLAKEHELATELARENYTKHPQQPAIATTWAFALYRQGQFNEAVKILEALPEAERQETSPALYYGLSLAGVGRTLQAKEYLALAEKSPDLLPEEKMLIAVGGKKPIKGTRLK